MDNVFACSADAFRIGVGQGRVSHVRVSNIAVYNCGTLIDFHTKFSKYCHCQLDDMNFSGVSATGCVRATMLYTDAAPCGRST